MPVPDFQTLMLPVLEDVSDGRERRHRDLFASLARRLELTPDDLAELLPSGAHSKFENRVRWAKWYLTKAGLLEPTGYGVFRISSRGREVLAGRPERIDIRLLEQFPEITELRGGERDANRESVPTTETPDEALASIHESLTSALGQELLDRALRASPAFFERLVVDLLVAMGYGGSRRDAGEAVGRSGDGGIDGIIKEDKLGLDVVYVQAKRWANPVGRPTVQAFAGSLEGHRARKGVLITTSSFTRDAREYVERIEKKIVLVDGEALASLMIENGVGVSEVEAYVVKRLDEDYFEGEAAGSQTDGDEFGGEITEEGGEG
jgi:restriction system protein